MTLFFYAYKRALTSSSLVQPLSTSNFYVESGSCAGTTRTAANTALTSEMRWIGLFSLPQLSLTPQCDALIGSRVRSCERQLEPRVDLRTVACCFGFANLITVTSVSFPFSFSIAARLVCLSIRPLHRCRRVAVDRKQPCAVAYVCVCYQNNWILETGASNSLFPRQEVWVAEGNVFTSASTVPVLANLSASCLIVVSRCCLLTRTGESVMVFISVEWGRVLWGILNGKKKSELRARLVWSRA